MIRAKFLPKTERGRSSSTKDKNIRASNFVSIPVTCVTFWHPCSILRLQKLHTVDYTARVAAFRESVPSGVRAFKIGCTDCSRYRLLSFSPHIHVSPTCSESSRANKFPRAVENKTQRRRPAPLERSHASHSSRPLRHKLSGGCLPPRFPALNFKLHVVPESLHEEFM